MLLHVLYRLRYNIEATRFPMANPSLKPISLMIKILKNVLVLFKASFVSFEARIDRLSYAFEFP